MKPISQFEKEIQKTIDSGLSIIPNPNTEDIAGVYYKGFYLGVALPKGFILPRMNKTFVDVFGVPFRGEYEAKKDIKNKLRIYQEKTRAYEGKI